MIMWIMFITVLVGAEPVTEEVSWWHHEQDCLLASIQLMTHPDNEGAIAVECLKVTLS